jgi:hypothetical protein
MAKGNNRHVVPNNGGWAVRKPGNGRVSSTHETQREAINAARTGAQRDQGEVVIHRPNGQIRDRDSYGADPHPPNDTRH